MTPTPHVAAVSEAEKLQAALYKIADTANSAEDLQELYSSIHKILGTLMYAKNCYVAVYDPATDMVSFPYWVDQQDPVFPPHKFRRGLTEYVLRTGQPLLATPQMLDELVRRGEVSRAGAPSLDWMGVPLKKGDRTFGVLVLQTYEPNIRYGQKETDLLVFVSQQIASAIEAKSNQQAIRESEAKFRALAESASSAIYIYDDARFLYVNPSTERIFGYSREELMSMEDPWVVVAPEQREAARNNAKRRMRGENVPSRYEMKILTKKGEPRWVDFSASSIQYAGHPANVATAIDITERKRAEELQSALYRIADKASTAVELSELYTAIHKIVGELMYTRNFYISVYDEERNLLTFPYFVDEEDPTPESKPLGKGLTEYVLRSGEPLLATPERFQELIRMGEVESIGAPSVDWLGVPLKTGNKTFGVLVVQIYKENVRYGLKEKDILTFVSQQIASAIDHKRSQEALKSSEARYRSLVQSAVYGIYRSSFNDRFLDVNPALVAMLGCDSAAEVLNLDLARDIYVDPSEHKELLNAFRHRERVEGIEAHWKRKDNKIITVRLSGRVLTNNRGEAEGYEMIAEDVTEHRQLELQLRQSQKMEAVGRLAGGVAHDFNNLLTVIKGHSELILGEVRSSDPIYTEAMEIRRAADRAASLTAQLLAFSRKQMMAPRIIDLNAIVGAMDNMLRRLLGEDVSLVINMDAGLGSVKADPGQLEQVVMNLAVNARDAMPKGGKLTIETSNVALDDLYLRDHADMKPGAYVMLAVTDTGMGMDKETIAHIFEPFFTTKEKGKGTGLGLSTTYGIVKQSGGYIWVYSEEGLGTTFKVYLPRVEGVAEGWAVDSQVATPTRGTESILLVEDEDGVRFLVKQVLQKNGYKVTEARDGAEAIRLCEAKDGPIHMLLTDVVLSEISGIDLAKKVAILEPKIKVLYMSGYTDDAIAHNGVLNLNSAFLQKPFTTEALARKVREVLDARS